MKDGYLRKFSAALWAFFIVVYIFAKVGFFTRYSDSSLREYVREHSIYWVVMAAIAFVIWLAERRFPQKTKLIIVAAGSVLVLGVVCLGAVHLLTSDMCGNQVVLEAKSPDGKHKAVIFERDCGATTDFSTQVSILKSSKNLGREVTGNAFVADSDKGAAPVSGVGVIALDVRWQNNKTVEIIYPEKARIFSRNSKVDDISIQYSAH